MPYRSYYQENVADPYNLQTNAPRTDHGLWDVIGRAIRSTVPERRNQSFDPNKPVDEVNSPYQKPGFFRALLGDKGRDLNSNAMMRQRDMDNADVMEGKNFGAWQKGVDYEDTIDDNNRLDQQKFITGRDNVLAEAATSLENLRQRGRREIADTTGINWLRREDARGRNMKSVAEYNARQARGRMYNPVKDRLNNAVAEKTEMDNTLRREAEARRKLKGSSNGENVISRGFHALFPRKQNEIKIDPADIPGGNHPADMQSSGAVQNGLVPADYDYDDDDDALLNELGPMNGGFNF